MSTLALTTNGKKISQRCSSIRNRLLSYGISIDIILFIVLLIVSNTHLLKGGFSSSLIFYPSAVKSGQWWRIFTYPFVHVSWYHLLLDAGAFFLLYNGLAEKRVSRKILYVIICGAFSLLAVLLASPLIYTRGLCGLSGIAHGLMAVSALEMMEQNKSLRMGLFFFLLVVSKSIYETITGEVVFSFMHLGLCGTPLAASHAGGVLGGILAYCIGRKFQIRGVKENITYS